MRLTPTISFYLISMPNFFKSLTIESFFKRSEALSAKKSRTPLF